MTTETKTKRKPPTVAQVLADQKKRSETDRALVPVNTAPLPATIAPPAATWLDEGPRLIRFNGQDGKFTYADTKEVVPAEERFIARCDQCAVGYIKFGGPGAKPDKRGELWHEAFQLPPREPLGDLDPATREFGLDSQKRDPWQVFTELLLMQNEEAFCFSTMNETGRRAVRTLLRHYMKMKRRWNGKGVVFPIVQLVPGSYQRGASTVHVPVFAVCGETSAADPSAPASLAEATGDAIPF